MRAAAGQQWAGSPTAALTSSMLPPRLLLLACVQGRKFGIRLWVLVPGAVPLRVYLHKNGLALFSATAYTPAGGRGAAASRGWRLNCVAAGLATRERHVPVYGTC